MGSFGLAHPHSPPQKLGSAKHHIVIIRPSDRNSHLAGKHAGKRTNVCEKPSFYTLRKQHANPPHPTPSQLQPLNPNSARAKTPFPSSTGSTAGPSPAGREPFTRPSRTKKRVYCYKTPPPFPQVPLPASPSSPSLGSPQPSRGRSLVAPGWLPSPAPAARAYLPARAAPAQAGVAVGVWGGGEEGGEGRRHRVRSGCRCRCRSESVLAAAAGDRGLWAKGRQTLTDLCRPPAGRLARRGFLSTRPRLAGTALPAGRHRLVPSSRDLPAAPPEALLLPPRAGVGGRRPRLMAAFLLRPPRGLTWRHLFFLGARFRHWHHTHAPRLWFGCLLLKFEKGALRKVCGKAQNHPKGGRVSSAPQRASTIFVRSLTAEVAPLCPCPCSRELPSPRPKNKFRWKCVRVGCVCVGEITTWLLKCDYLP